MKNFYYSLALSYRQWYFRTTTERLDRWGPAVGFTAPQCLNIFSLLIILLPYGLPAWAFIGLPFVFGAGIFRLVQHIYKANPVEVSYANLSDAVPGISEFPFVYGYALVTFVLFAGCILAVMPRAA